MDSMMVDSLWMIVQETHRLAEGTNEYCKVLYFYGLLIFPVVFACFFLSIKKLIIAKFRRCKER